MAKSDYLSPEEQAWKVVEDKRNFKKHLTAYIGCALMFFFINVVTSPGDWWFYWPMFGWGIGLLWHFVGVYVTESIGADDENWAESEYQKQLARFRPKRENHWDDDEDELDLEENPLKSARANYRDSDLV